MGAGKGQIRGYPSECCLGQLQTKVEKKNARDEFLVFFVKERVGEMARDDVEDRWIMFLALGTLFVGYLWKINY